MSIIINLSNEQCIFDTAEFLRDEAKDALAWMLGRGYTYTAQIEAIKYDDAGERIYSSDLCRTLALDDTGRYTKIFERYAWSDDERLNRKAALELLEDLLNESDDEPPMEEEEEEEDVPLF